MDMISYVLGKEAGAGEVVLDSTAYTFTDTNSDGNIVIEEGE